MSRGHPGLVRANVQSQNLRSGPRNPGRNQEFFSMTPGGGGSKDFGQENFGGLMFCFLQNTCGVLLVILAWPGPRSANGWAADVMFWAAVGMIEEVCYTSGWQRPSSESRLDPHPSQFSI